MADLAGSYSNHSSYPWADYTVSYSQTGRSASTVSYKVTVSYDITHDSGYGYGFDIYANYSIGGQSGSIKIKDTWGALSGSASFNITCSTNSSGGTLYAKVYSSSSNDPTHSQQAFSTGDRTVNKSSFNTAPYWSGAVISVNPSGTIAENTTSLSVSWSAARDTESTSGMKYTVDRYINGKFNATIATNITSTSCVDNIGLGNSGSTYSYRVTPTDSGGLVGAALTNSQSATKNVLYISTISGVPKILYDTTSFTFAVVGGSNSSGTGDIHRSLSSPVITIYNPTISIGTITISVYKSGTLPTTPYVRFNDVVNLFKNESNQSGNFNIILTTSNDWGSSGTSSLSVSVDLKTIPNPPTNISITGTKTVNGTNYYIPSLQNLTLTWSNGSDKVNGSALKYKIQGSTNAVDGWRDLTNNISSGTSTTSSTVQIPDDYFNGGGIYYFKIIGSNDYGYETSIISQSITLHKYSNPTISFGLPRRSTTQVTIPITTLLNTSIPSTTFISGKRNYVLTIKDTATIVASSTALTASPQSVIINGLTGSNAYTLTITIRDNTGLSSDIVASFEIGKYIPIFSIREYGIGVNDYADANYVAKIVGNMNVNGTINATDMTINGYNVYHAGRKPTKSDVGLGSVNNYGISSTISSASTTTYASTYMVSLVRAEKANLASPTFTGTVAAPTINATTALQLNGTNVVERGSTTDGNWVRYADGTQICWKSYSFGSATMTTQTASPAVYGGSTYNFTFPVAFSEVPAVTTSCGSSGYTNSQSSSESTTSFIFRRWANYSTSVTGMIYNYIAIGRWK